MVQSRVKSLAKMGKRDRLEEIKDLDQKITFVTLINNGYKGIQPNIIVGSRKKSEVIAEVEKFGLNKELLGKVSIGNCTEDEVDVLVGKRDKKINLRTELEQTAPGGLWFRELEEFERVYHRHY